MHILAATLLGECASVKEALGVIADANITSSTALTLVDKDEACSVELSPAGNSLIRQCEDYVIRTNHFLAEKGAAAEKQNLYFEDSINRYSLLQSRLSEHVPSTARQSVELLISSPDEAPLCCFADETKPFGERWATLCTATTNPALKELRVFDGAPSDAGAENTENWRTMRA